MTAAKLSVALGLLLSASLVAASPPRFWHELPPEEAITDPPSMASEDREDLREYLTNLNAYYKVRHWDAVGEKYLDVDQWIEAMAEARGVDPGTVSHPPGRVGAGLRNHLLLGEIEDWDRRSRRWIRVPLRPQDDPWIFETAWGLLAEDPVDWETLLLVVRLQWEYVDYDPRWTRIAEYLLELPLVPRGEGRESHGLGTVQNVGGWRHFMVHWPESASEILAKGVTLPYQPEDRRIMPPDPGANADAIQERERHWASEVRNTLNRWATQEELAEMASYIEADVEAGAFELDAEIEEWLESIRE